jgi:hypothetical protein
LCRRHRLRPLFLSGLTNLLAKARQVSPLGEILKHTGVGFTVIVMSKAIGLLIQGAIRPAPPRPLGRSIRPTNRARASILLDRGGTVLFAEREVA